MKRQFVEQKTVKRIDWVRTEEQLADVFTKRNAKTDPILSVVSEGNLMLKS